MSVLDLFFPQWQGAGYPNNLKAGADLLRPLFSDRAFVEVPVPEPHPLTLENGIWGYADILAQLRAARRILEAHAPERLFTLGGDCGVELAPVSYLNRRHAGKLAVIWLDAHADLNTPESSPSHQFHGMPLRALLGEGDDTLSAELVSVLDPAQIYLVGMREMDPPERELLNDRGIDWFQPESLHDGFAGLIEAIRRKGQEAVYIHLDLDVLDPSAFEWIQCPTPGGLKVSELRALLQALIAKFPVAGSSLLEFNGDKPLPPQVATLLQDLMHPLYPAGQN